MWKRKQKKKRLFQQIMDDHHESITRVAWGYIDAAHRREDLEQEIHMALWRALDGFRGDCSLRTFVFRVAHNHCISKIVRKKKQPSLANTGAEAERIVASTQDTMPLADEQMIQQQAQQKLRDAIQQLALPYRQVVMLAMEQMSHAEIADVVGISKSNVGVRLNRAKEMLRGMLGQEER